MSLAQAISEIETLLDSISGLSKHPDTRDESLVQASVSDGNYLVSVSGGGKPWPEAAPANDGPSFWIAEVRVEVSTLIQVDAQADKIRSVERGRQVVEKLRWTGFPSGQLWPLGEPQPTVNDRQITWSATYNLRYQE